MLPPLSGKIGQRLPSRGCRLNQKVFKWTWRAYQSLYVWVLETRILKTCMAIFVSVIVFHNLLVLAKYLFVGKRYFIIRFLL